MPVHSPQDTAAQILEEFNAAVLKVGRLLEERQRRAPKSFERWVADECPFDVATARRILAAARAWTEDDPGAAPAPWLALAG